MHCSLLRTLSSDTILIYLFRSLAAVCQFLIPVSFLFLLSSNLLQFQPTSFSVVFLFSRSFHSDSQYLFCHFSLFPLLVCLHHINISDFINFALSLHKGERKICIIYPLFVLILLLSSLWGYEIFL